MPDDPIREALSQVLIEQGLDTPGAFHSWRCQYPDRYGPCDCMAETITAILERFDLTLKQSPTPG